MSVIKCPNCGTQVSSEDNTCFVCGTPLSSIGIYKKETLSFCQNCGTELINNAKFCRSCGTPVDNNNSSYSNERHQVFQGTLFKCPNCGEVLNSFTSHCPSCGYEIRGAKATNSVREFALKLEQIEANREREQSKGFFSKVIEIEQLSMTDEQKVSLIQSFSVPNTIEDMLEFMILATSNVNMAAYAEFPSNAGRKRRVMVSDAWLAKAEQVYKKAKITQGNTELISKIETLYNDCIEKVSKNKRKSILKLGLMFLVPILPVVMFAPIAIFGIVGTNMTNSAEEKRMEGIEIDVGKVLNEGKYDLALDFAESMEYNGYDEESKRKWTIKRETLIEDILETAERNGVELKRTDTPPEEPEVSSESAE